MVNLLERVPASAVSHKANALAGIKATDSRIEAALKCIEALKAAGAPPAILEKAEASIAKAIEQGGLA
jgi:hypothetical protein